MCVGGWGLKGRGASVLRAATAVDHHAGDLAVNDLLLVVEVEHVDG